VPLLAAGGRRRRRAARARRARADAEEGNAPPRGWDGVGREDWHPPLAS
jgi:hypothetical protein